MSLSLHHFIHTHNVDEEKFERLHTKKYVRFFDKFIFLIAFIGPLATAPQAFQIFITHNASGVSAVTWLFYDFVQLSWLLYGIAHRDKPIILSNIFWVFWQTLVLIGAIIY